MSVTRDELHHLVDQLPQERLAPVLELIRSDAPLSARRGPQPRWSAYGNACTEVTGVDEELQRFRDEGRS